MIPQKTIEELINKHSLLEKDLSSGKIDKKFFAEKSKEYADLNEIIEDAKKYISFEKDKMTLRIPIEKASAIGLRSVSSPELILKAMETLKGRARVKRAMWSRRAQEYEQKINSGDLIAIAEVVRDLHRNDEQREQSYSERQLYEAALERLTRELAVVDGVEESAAQAKVDQVLDARAA